nr:COMT protein [Stephania japonica]
MENKHYKDHDKDDLMFAFELIGASNITMVMLAAAELDLFEIIARAGPKAQLSALDIASQIPTKNPEASMMVDRILAFLTCHSVLTCSGAAGEDGTVDRMYGLAPVCKYFVKDENGGSLIPLLTLNTVLKDAYHLKDAVLLEGAVPFLKVHGMSLFQYLGKEKKFNQPFHSHDFNATEMIMKVAIDKYKGFENVNVVVDLGGGIGTALKMIISKHPKIRGINFDLPHVIANVPPIPVEHVGGTYLEAFQRQMPSS